MKNKDTLTLLGMVAFYYIWYKFTNFFLSTIYGAMAEDNENRKLFLELRYANEKLKQKIAEHDSEHDSEHDAEHDANEK